MTETSPLSTPASMEDIIPSPNNISSTSIDPSNPLSRQSHPRGAPMDAGDAPAITPEDQTVKTKRPLLIGGYLDDDKESGRKARGEDEVGYSMVVVERQKGQENTNSNDDSFDDTEEEEDIEALVRFVIDKAKKDLYAEKIANCSASAGDSSSATPERNFDECVLDPFKDSVVTGEGIAPAESLEVKGIIDDIAEHEVDGPHGERHNGQENVKGEEGDVNESNETAIREQEQDLDEMVRMIINEAARSLILDRKEDIECILENAEKQAPVGETGGGADGDDVNFDGTNEMDFDLKIHDFAGRFKVCERGEGEIGDGNGIIDGQTVKKNVLFERREENGGKEQVEETRDNDEEDEDGEFFTSEEELDLTEGFVIDAARSSFMKNFDVFAFYELVARNENICSAGEQSNEDGENADITDLTQGRKETLSRFSEDGKHSDMTEVPACDVISRGDDQFGEQIGKDEGDSSPATEDDKQVEMHIEETGTPVEQEKSDCDADERKEVETEECGLNDCRPQDGESSVEKSEEKRDNGSTEGENALKTTERNDQYPDDEETKNSTSAITPEVIRQTTEEGILSSQDESQQDTNAANSPQQNDEKQDGNEMAELSEADPQAAVKTPYPTAQSLQATDNLSNKTQTSCHSNATTPVIGSQVPITVCAIDSDLDDDDDDDYDDDICNSVAKPDDDLNTSESDWECLAIQRASKCQNSYGEPLHSWYPAYDTAHLGAMDALKEHKENSSKRLEVKMSETACQSKSPTNEKKDSMHSFDDSKITDMVNDPPAPDRPTESLSKQAFPSHQPPQSSSRDAPVEANSGMALINDRLRKKILLLEQRLKQLALELTFLGDRNWRLEAYIDCLIKTLEVLDVTDVVDLDQKTLPLCLFKVKVKAGYKLGPYNGIPSRSLRSYAKEGRQAPFVDLSGWGDTDKPAKRPDPINPTPVASEDDDVGLSASQMYDYESQLEELNIQNQIMETQLRDANERLQSLIGMDNAADGGQVGPLDIQQQQQQQHTDLLKPPQEVLQQHLQQIQEYHEKKGKEYPPQQQQLQKEQVPQQQQQPTFNVVMQQTEQQQQQQQQQQCYVVHDSEYYPLPSQPQEMLPTQHQLPLPQQQQPLHQFQQYQPPLQQQQQQPNQPMFQQSWNPNLTEPEEEAVLTSVSDCDYGEKLCLQDPLEWPSLTESQAKLSAPCQSQTSANEKSVPRANQQFSHPQSFANGPIIAVPSDPSRDKSTLYSSLTLPASTGSIPSYEDRYKTTHNLDKKSDKTRSSVSFQDLRNGRRFENEKRPRPTRYSPSPLIKSRSGIDTTSVPKFRRDEGSTRRYENRDPMKESFPLSTHSDLPSLLGQTWRCKSPFHPNNQTASSFLPPSYHHRNFDRNRRFISYGESVLDSDHMDYRGMKQELPFSKDLSQSLSDSGQTFKPAFDGSEFEKFPGPGPNPGGFGGSSPNVHGLHYPRQNNKWPATPTRRGKPWNRAGLPRHSSYSSPLRSRNTLD